MIKRSLIPFLISFLLLVATILVSERSFRDMREYASLVDHTRMVITEFEKLSNDFKSAQIYSPSMAGGKRSDFYQLYHTDGMQVEKELQQLDKLIRDNPSQVKRLDTITKLV